MDLQCSESNLLVNGEWRRVLIVCGGQPQGAGGRQEFVVQTPAAITTYRTSGFYRQLQAGGLHYDWYWLDAVETHENTAALLDTQRQVNAVLLGTEQPVADLAAAQAARAGMEKLAMYAPPELAVQLPAAYPLWSGDGVVYQDGTGAQPQSKARYGGHLYKCLQGHTSQPSWTPDVVPALWAVIDETHAGTIGDPIPAARGMIYYKDKYYLDPNGKTYLCIRDRDDAPGSGLQLQYLPSELVGQYFEEVGS